MLSFNVEGLKRNKHYLNFLLCNLKPGIVFLQETWLPYSDQNLISNFHPTYNFKIASSDMFEHPEDRISSTRELLVSDLHLPVTPYSSYPSMHPPQDKMRTFLSQYPTYQIIFIPTPPTKIRSSLELTPTAPPSPPTEDKMPGITSASSLI